MIFCSDKPDVSVGPANPYIIVEGDPATINCTVADANPAATYFRFRQLLESWSSWGSSNTQTYTSIDRSKAGVYKCRAKNTVGGGPENALQLDVHCEFIRLT